MRVAILGAAGFVGAALFRNLIREGYAVAGFTRADGDLRTMDLLSRLKAFGPDLVINCAAQTAGIVGQRTNPGDLIYENLLIHANAPKLAVEAGAHLYMNMLTSSTYPEKGTLLLPSDLESGPPHESVEPYSAPKRASVAIARAYAKQFKLKTLHVVPTSIYGARDNFTASGKVLASLVVKFMNAVDAGSDSVEILGTGTPVRDWTHVDDVAIWMEESIKLFAGFEHTQQPVVHLTSGNSEISVRDLAHLIGEESGFKKDILFNASYPDGAIYKVLAATHPFKQSILLREGVRRTIAWRRQKEY